MRLLISTAIARAAALVAGGLRPLQGTAPGRNSFATVRPRMLVCVFVMAVAAVAGVLLPTPARAQAYEVLHGFSLEAGHSMAPLLVAADGSLLGTTTSGGRFGLGSVFVLTPNGAGFDFANLWEFSGADGWQPGALVRGNDGALYGTTEVGGASDFGTVFRITISGSLTTLYSFTGTDSDGGNPARLVQGSDGSFYGTASGARSGHRGTVFRITSSGSLTTLYRFTGADGAYPSGGLVEGTDGKFYGTTSQGGGSGAGTVYRIDSSGSLLTLHHFGGRTSHDGWMPRGELVQGSDGTFYGTTSAGSNGGVNHGGTIFKINTFEIDTSGSLTTLHWLRGADGTEPSGLIQGSDGHLYGTTYRGGASGGGTVFRIAPAGSLTTLHHFTGYSDGREPFAALVQGSDGAFYGTTTFATDSQGGNGGGTVFRMNTLGSLATIHTFTNSDGYLPEAGLVQGSDGDFYGATQTGGAGGRGTVFRIDTAGSLATLHSFRGTDGAYPLAGLFEGSDGDFYGTTSGGTNTDGTVFRITSTGVLTSLHSFGLSSDGGYPVAGLVQGGDGSFYGTTASLSGNVQGTVFKIDSFGSLTTLHRFEGSAAITDGGFPTAGLVQGSDGFFYGTTSGSDLVFNNDPVSYGTVFRINSSGSLTTLHRFDGTDGEFPFAGLIQGTDGKFYGTTSQGGAADLGTVFRIDALGSLTMLHSFLGTDGAHPKAGLVQASDGSFYGTTTDGGSGRDGTIFRINSAGSLTTLHNFVGAVGGHRLVSGLVQGNDGSFYGTAGRGGPYNGGVVFRLTLPPNTAAGSNVSVQDSSALNPVQVTFNGVSAAGTTSVAPIDPASAGEVPGGFAVLGSVAYQIETSAVFSGPVTIGFVVPGPITEADFNSLMVLHNDGGALVDVTATSPARDYATRTIYAVTSSLSPFYIGRTGPHIATLFDQTKARKSGSTVPIKLRLFDPSHANISSPSIILTTRNLSRVGGNTATSVVDAGNANPDGTFRYDSALGGYVFNLSTKGLTPGLYCLSFWTGADRAFFHTVTFEVR